MAETLKVTLASYWLNPAEPDSYWLKPSEPDYYWLKPAESHSYWLKLAEPDSYWLRPADLALFGTNQVDLLHPVIVQKLVFAITTLSHFSPCGKKTKSKRNSVSSYLWRIELTL